MRILYFNITRRCNLRCWFCAASLNRRSEISTKKILSLFDKWKIRKGDRVILNGGEATLHRGLCEILRNVKKRHARSNLFTNGIKLADTRYALRLACCGLDYVCIPLYGKTAAQHDAMTGVKGSFAKTCAAISHLCELKNRGYKITLEVKLLHCKATYRRNPAIARWIADQYPNIDYISVNPPLYTGEARVHLKDFAVDLMKTKRWLNKTVTAVLDKKVRCSLPHIPYCVLGRKNRSDRWRKGFLPYPLRQPMIYYDPQITTGVIVRKEKIIDSQCRMCAYRVRCPGFRPYNLGETSSEGSSIIKPAKLKNISKTIT